MAYSLQDLIRSTLFVPLSYLFWGLNIMYLSVAQLVYWALLVIGVALMAFGSLYGKERARQWVEEKSAPLQGPLQATAGQISKAGKGTYYKWVIANRMGKLARSVLSFRDGAAMPANSPLAGRDWDPPAEVGAYLESGLTRTFADYPRRRWFSRPVETPFDIDLNRVLAYLESQMEDRRD
jgi:hypothetical protein